MTASLLSLSIFETRLSGRYITLNDLLPLYDFYENIFNISVVGHSEKNAPIHLVKVGSGEKKILGWSQMHGNESTTTKAVFDFLAFIHQNKKEDIVQQFLKTHTFYIIPMLNPDGAVLYTRENANCIDLNRDAQEQSQAESKVLHTVFNTVSPDLALNLHDQRTIYGLSSGKPATVSFLAPAADVERKVSDAREVAMKAIVKMQTHLETIIPEQVGRYDDSFNPNCVGDTFAMAAVPTILFEAGHYKDDYKREETRCLILEALLVFFNLKPSKNKEASIVEYFLIPENEKNYCDVLLTNVKIEDGALVSVAIQFEEVLVKDNIAFKPKVLAIDDETIVMGHQIIDCGGSTITINGTKNLIVGDLIENIHHTVKNIDILLTLP